MTALVDASAPASLQCFVNDEGETAASASKVCTSMDSIEQTIGRG